MNGEAYGGNGPKIAEKSHHNWSNRISKLIARSHSNVSNCCYVSSLYIKTLIRAWR